MKAYDDKNNVIWDGEKARGVAMLWARIATVGGFLFGCILFLFGEWSIWHFVMMMIIGLSTGLTLGFLLYKIILDNQIEVTEAAIREGQAKRRRR